MREGLQQWVRHRVHVVQLCEPERKDMQRTQDMFRNIIRPYCKRVWSFSLLLIAGAAVNVALVVNFYCRYSGVSNENVPAHANVCEDHVVYHHPARRVQAQPNILHAQCAGISQARMSSVPSSHKTVPIGVLIYWASLCHRDAYVKREPVL